MNMSDYSLDAWIGSHIRWKKHDDDDRSSEFITTISLFPIESYFRNMGQITKGFSYGVKRLNNLASH